MLGVGNCNWKMAKWQSDYGYIEDTSLLPIQGFKYGPLNEQMQEANITIGAIECFPSDTPEYNIAAHVQSITNRMDTIYPQVVDLIERNNSKVYFDAWR